MKFPCPYCGTEMNPTALATMYGLIKGRKCPACDFEYTYRGHNTADDVTLYFPDEEKLKRILQNKKGVVQNG